MRTFIFAILLALLTACGAKYQWRGFLEDYEELISRYSEQAEKGEVDEVLQLRLEKYSDEAVELMEKLEANDPAEAGQFRRELLQLFVEYDLLLE